MFNEIFVELLQKKNITAYRLSKDVGISAGLLSSYKKGTKIPANDNLKKIADYLGVSTDYLLTGKIPDPPNIYVPEGIAVFEEIGTVKAGYDGYVDEIATGNKISIPVEMLKGHTQEEFFVLRVSGNSMYPVLIDGDNILCLRCTSVDNGDTAVVLYDGEEATVKKVHYVSGENWLELIPANPEYQPKRIENKDLEKVQILGKVVSLVRMF